MPRLGCLIGRLFQCSKSAGRPFVWDVGSGGAGGGGRVTEIYFPLFTSVME